MIRKKNVNQLRTDKLVTFAIYCITNNHQIGNINHINNQIGNSIDIEELANW